MIAIIFIGGIFVGGEGGVTVIRVTRVICVVMVINVI